MSEGTSALFECEIALPDPQIASQAKRLIGFEARYNRIRQLLRLLIDRDGVEQWSKAHYGKRLPLIGALLDRYPLVIFEGDVGTGKTATAEGTANALATELHKEAMLFKISTRVRGSGNVGEMSTLINKAFDIVAKEAGKSRSSYLIVDEADSLAASRNGVQSHHEDKVAVNTLIQKIDDVRRHDGRVLVFLCTNRIKAIDPAILRRAAHIERFARPSESERRQLLLADCDGLNLPNGTIEEIVQLTGPSGAHALGYTFSDLRTRVLPDALSRAFPERMIEKDDLIAAICSIAPSPSIMEDGI